MLFEHFENLLEGVRIALDLSDVFFCHLQFLGQQSKHRMPILFQQSYLTLGFVELFSKLADFLD